VIVIEDEHSVTKEILQSFGPVVNGPLAMKHDLSKIGSNPLYKTVMKETNAKSNSIFN